MLLVIETSERGKALDRVTFKRIGDIAAKLIADPVKLAAAAQDTQRKGAEAEAPAQLCPEREVAFRDFTGSVKQPGGNAAGSSYGHRTVSALRLVSSRCKSRPFGPTEVAFAPRRLDFHLVLIVDNGMKHQRISP